MKAITGSILAILMTVPLSAAQKASTTKTYDLRGPVKTVYETTMHFDRRGNGFMDMPVQEPSHNVIVFDRRGELLLSQSLDIPFHCGFVVSPLLDTSKWVYDSSGNLVE